jgi:dihydropteroate synthase-like protein
MKVLLVTGLLAKDIVEQYARKSSAEATVLALNVSVAAFLTPQRIAEELGSLNLKGYDVILVPGLVNGNVKPVEDATGIPTYKGPKYAADIPAVLKFLGKVKLSKELPACEILKGEIQRRALEELADIERMRDLLLKNPGNIKVGGLGIGKDFPMRVMAEIVDAPLLSDGEIEALARQYVHDGADIIDVGMLAEEPRPQDAKRAIMAVKRAVNVPVSIDTLNPDEAREAVSAGCDMILSVDAGNMRDIASFASKIAVVVIPTNHKEGFFPIEAEKRVEFLERNIEEAKKLGLEKVIGDLILGSAISPGITESLIAYRSFAKRNPDVPLLMGIGNVVELIDADSVGVNALLTCIASEIGANILLTTEKSAKAKGSIKELSTASKMMFIAKKKSSVPKDLGLDLLILKDKSRAEEPYNAALENDVLVIKAVENVRPPAFDPKGCFKIMVDRQKDLIAALYFPTLNCDKPSLIIKGKRAGEIYNKIVEMKLITRLDHAAYLGSELTKAEIALKIGKNYIQDNPLFAHVFKESS